MTLRQYKSTNHAIFTDKMNLYIYCTKAIDTFNKPVKPYNRFYTIVSNFDQ